jgi:hypothetical protein
MGDSSSSGPIIPQYDGTNFLLCSACNVAYSPEGAMLEYCGECSKTRETHLPHEGFLALLTSRRTKFNRNSWSVPTKARYDKLIRLGGKVYVMLDTYGIGDGPIWDWETVTGEPVYTTIMDWAVAMREQRREIIYGWKRKNHPKELELYEEDLLLPDISVEDSLKSL